ncbi:hypothetical protein CG723_29445 [Streptomyces sp. CB01635]|uniref:hypothetical protein n=1 Tax=unclassified Streptomyces TaxID=2593676 RepID=UPI000C26F534|nr:hypothetical protein [Streptomyces sp. CB01635]PJN08133.1 hypothetical protein CG723_29445 [Streptomyces sp. CB01635]
MNATPYPGKRLHHYLEASLHEDRWTVSCATAPRGGFGLGPHETSGDLDEAVRSVTAQLAELVGAPESALSVVVETDPSAQAIAAAPAPGESYRIRVCIAEGAQDDPPRLRLRTADLGCNVYRTPPDDDADIPDWVGRQLADKHWLTEAERRTLTIKICRHPGVDWLEARGELQEHAREFNAPAFAAMRLRHKQRLDALPATDPLTDWITETLCEVLTRQGHHRYCGPILTLDPDAVPVLVAACRRAADLLEQAHPEVIARLDGLGRRALAAEPQGWAPLMNGHEAD